MNIIGISGRKQAGKNTVANILHGIALKNNSLIKDWNVGPNGELMILTENEEDQEGWGEFDITRRDEQFTQYAEHSMWPHVKLYSFADRLKWICTELFDIPKECAWGADEQKNQPQKHLLWENMPKAINSSLMKKLLAPDAKKSWDWKEGPMTAREFMQFLGTDIMRKIYGSVWVNSTIKKITREQSELAIIADVRFPNEAKAIENAGGVVVRLTRKVSDDNHDSEVALDEYPFKHFIDNKDGSLDSMAVKVNKFFRYLQEN
tara:strand:- start:1018 stop:1803 length:786 start_codon:yes stop_codon:yes gene_type:complete